MPKIDRRTGRCLCGDVSFTARKVDLKVTACHCDMCRRWGGSPFMEVSCGTDVVFEGEDNVAVYDSSDWAERGFCKLCGSHLFYRLRESREHQMPVGLLDDQSGLSFDAQVFIDSKPSFYNFSNKTSDMTGAEVFEKYAPPAE